MDTEKVERNRLIIEMYKGGEGMSIAELARTFNVSETVIRQQLDKAGVRKTKRPGSHGQYDPRRWKNSVERFEGHVRGASRASTSDLRYRV